MSYIFIARCIIDVIREIIDRFIKHILKSLFSNLEINLVLIFCHFLQWSCLHLCKIKVMGSFNLTKIAIKLCAILVFQIIDKS